jgi:hypothetical protein
MHALHATVSDNGAVVRLHRCVSLMISNYVSTSLLQREQGDCKVWAKEEYVQLCYIKIMRKYIYERKIIIRVQLTGKGESLWP